MPFKSLKLMPLSKTASAGGASGRASYLKATYRIQSWNLDPESPAIVINLMPDGAGSLGKQDYAEYEAEVLASFKNFGYGIPPKVEEVGIVEVANVPTPPVDEPGN